MTVISKKVYIDKLEGITDKNSSPGTIKMKPADIMPVMYFEHDVEHKDKDPICKVDDHVRISKYKNIEVIFLLKS